ncbi:gluconokinase [Cohnella sp. LGH]|uniref:gluconokinase n=1 Tax=Cohnella sp. LGH TaxID=1619153 RepID=UPI001ADBD9F8|nr:gluconokinase [Cohnella sp. LGH]QTH42844.1 gluconokinase [Cohnella sp. LGH]
MHNGKAIIGIDIGTTSTKSVVFGEGGSQLGSLAVEYPLLQEQPGWAEQEPETILRALAQSVCGALAQSGLSGEDVAAVGFSTAMHSLIAVDENGRPLTRSITWADGRSEPQVRRIREELNGLAIYRRTGTPIHPMSPLPKLMWLREHRPEVWAEARRFVSIKEYVIYRLFGEWAVDPSLASSTGLLSLDTLTWDEEALQAAGLDADKLSDVRPVTYRLQGMDRALADDMGLRPDTPFFLGSSDGALANLGVGAVGPGDTAVTIGTSAAMRMITDKPLTDERMRTFCYSVAHGSYVIGGATNNGAIVLQWMRDSLFGGSKTIEELLKAAAGVSAGADGLLFLPFLSGERAPIYNAEARGTYLGANLGHGQAHFVRAGLEGVLFAVLSVAESLRELAGPASEIRASGGFAKSPLWLQMLADMLGQEVAVPRVTEASAFGAAMMAMQGLGQLADLSSAKEWAPIAQRLQPDSQRHAVYRELFAIYERSRDGLLERFAELTQFQRRSL